MGVMKFIIVNANIHFTSKLIFIIIISFRRSSPHLWAASVGNRYLIINFLLYFFSSILHIFKMNFTCMYYTSWRTTGDIHPTWPSILGILQRQHKITNYAGPGGWNDPDMLQVGNG